MRRLRVAECLVIAERLIGQHRVLRRIGDFGQWVKGRWRRAAQRAFSTACFRRVSDPHRQHTHHPSHTPQPKTNPVFGFEKYKNYISKWSRHFVANLELEGLFTVRGLCAIRGSFLIIKGCEKNKNGTNKRDDTPLLASPNATHERLFHFPCVFSNTAKHAERSYNSTRSTCTAV